MADTPQHMNLCHPPLPGRLILTPGTMASLLLLLFPPLFGLVWEHSAEEHLINKVIYINCLHLSMRQRPTLHERSDIIYTFAESCLEGRMLVIL